MAPTENTVTNGLDCTEDALAYAIARRSQLPAKWLRWNAETETRPLTEWEIARIIDMARDGSGFCVYQLREWAKDGHKNAPDPTFKQGAALLLDVIASPLPWNVSTLWPEPKERAANVLTLMDFADQVRQIKQRTLYLVPASTDLVLDLILGKGWEQRFKKFLAAIRKRAVQP